MAATTCASEGTAGRKVILLASAMVRHATQRRLGKKPMGVPSCSRRPGLRLQNLRENNLALGGTPPGACLFCNTPHHSPRVESVSDLDEAASVAHLLARCAEYSA